MKDTIKVPFSIEQVKALKERQEKEYLHEYTCPHCPRKLEPHFLGLMCYKHGIVQDWVWKGDVENA